LLVTLFVTNNAQMPFTAVTGWQHYT